MVLVLYKGHVTVKCGDLKCEFHFLSSVFRNFKLYLTTNTGLFTKDFKAVFVDKNGQEKNYDVQLQNYFTGHVVGK